ncbi:cation-transporting P-type ATPase [Svornostia abyssi]|uniref:Cation-transporting P-type ATPase n=1 Tax=Svornostia abyssi TaxID=2898438 RepID=A0ABY5PH26_9ACTN|nr:cation-transporting P-type ATPase [Parviterribacteraceae bacterium J379]
MASHAPPAPAGLTAAEAATRLAADGPNVLPTQRPPSQLRLFAAQMVHFFALMLWTAGALAFVAGLPELGVAIFVVIVINGVFAFVQEHRAERAAAKLRDLIPRRARVVRDGLPTEISSEELVVGDLVLLESGDRISADLSAVTAHSLSIDTSTLTGESVPESADDGDAVLAGTFVVEGDGTAVVTATAGATRLAGIAQLTQASTRPPGPLAAELRRVVQVIAALAVGVGTTFFALALALGTDPNDGFIFAIGVTVALVPEGLLPTVTLSLALGAQRMAERNALVRRLEAVETLGSTTCICTDKTGTLTQNEMAVIEVWTPAGAARVRGRGYEPEGTVEADDALLPALRDLAVTAVRCSTGRAVLEDGRWIAHGDPMEAALDAFAKRLGVEGPAHAHADGFAHRFPFDPRRRRMSLSRGDRVLTKGAPDAVLPLCDPAVAARAAEVVDELAARGLRLLAIAARPIAPDETPPATAEDAERDLDLLGLVGLEDPPRPEAQEAIAGARAAGVHILMITGDHPQTAVAIAREVGLTDGGAAVLGADLPDGEGELGALLDHDGLVVARVSPEQKLRIARALRARGHVVAMTGDGVNDGPALQEADIGIAMGRSGTDVAREAADLVLLDDNFATIVDAIAQGRATFLNIRRFLTYHLSANVAELTPFLVWALSTGNIPLALGVLQVICIDLVTDIAPSAALGAEPPSPRVLEGPPPRGRLLNRSVLRRGFGVLGPTLAIVSMAAFGATLVAAGWRPGAKAPDGDTLLAASGAAFAAVVIGQAANAFACRSSVTVPWRLDRPRNPLLLGAVASMFVVLAILLFVPPLADLLEQAPPTLLGAAVALLAAPAVLLADAADKARRATASA